MIEELAPYEFSFDCWAAGSLSNLGIKTRTNSIEENRALIRRHAVGFLEGSKLWVRPKLDTVAVKFFYDNISFWTHLTTKEFEICFPELKR